MYLPTQEPPADSAMLRPSDGDQIIVNDLGRSVKNPQPRISWNHPWRPFLGGQSITFTLAAVSSLALSLPIEPTIKSNGKQLPMSGQTGTVPTPLALDPSVASKDGISYAALEVHPDPTTGELTKDSLVQIVHTNHPVSLLTGVGLCAITLILWSQGQPIQALPLVHFNLRYLRVMPATGNTSGAPKHLFL
jgi:hypothetical protein